METKIRRIFYLQKQLDKGKMMKKAILSLILGLFLVTSSVFAESFDKLEGLTAVQQQKLSQIQFNFKQKNAEIEKKLSAYQDKLNQIKTPA